MLARHENIYEGPVLTITTAGGTIRTTVYHPFWVERGRDLAERSTPRELAADEDQGGALAGRWVNSHELRVGDVLVGADASPQAILRIEQEFKSAFPVNNLTIDGLHTFAFGHDSVLVHNTAACGGVNPRLTQRLDAFRAYRANNPAAKMRDGIKATQGNPAYGSGFNSGFRQWSLATSQIQNHHLISNKMVTALDDVGFVGGQALRERPGLQYMSSAGGHVGYEEWHRVMDDDMVRFIGLQGDSLTEDKLLEFIHNYYQQPDLIKRIPGVNLGF